MQKVTSESAYYEGTHDFYILLRGAVAWRCTLKKVFLEISQNSQENICARASFLIKLNTSGGCFWANQVFYQFRKPFIRNKLNL